MNSLRGARTEMSHSPAPLGSSRFVPSFSLAVVNRNFSLGRDSHAGTPRAFPWAVRSWMTLSEGPGKVLPQVGFPSSLCGKQLNRRNFLGQLAIVPHKRRSVEGSCYRALRAPAASVLRRGQGLPPLSPHRFLRSRNGVTVEVDFTRTVTGLLRYPPFRGINHDCGPGNADTGKGE